MGTNKIYFDNKLHLANIAIEGLMVKRKTVYASTYKSVYMKGVFMTDDYDYLLEFEIESRINITNETPFERSIQTLTQETIDQLGIVRNGQIQKGTFVANTDAFILKVHVCKKAKLLLDTLFENGFIKEPSRIDEQVARILQSYDEPYIHLCVYVGTTDLLTVAVVASICSYCKEEDLSLSIIYRDGDNSFIQEINE